MVHPSAFVNPPQRDRLHPPQRPNPNQNTPRRAHQTPTQRLFLGLSLTPTPLPYQTSPTRPNPPRRMIRSSRALQPPPAATTRPPQRSAAATNRSSPARASARALPPTAASGSSTVVLVLRAHRMWVCPKFWTRCRRELIHSIPVVVHPDFHHVGPVCDVPLGPKLRYRSTLYSLQTAVSTV